MLIAGHLVIPCVLGREGIVAAKREGDGGTPRGRLPLRSMLQRPGRGPKLRTALPHRFTRADDAWCDEPADPRYNRAIRRTGKPADVAEERLWRPDPLYDVVVPLGWNDGPIRKGHGSAIFWHIAREPFSPTAGCVAVRPEVFRRLLPRLSRHTIMWIG